MPSRLAEHLVSQKLVSADKVEEALRALTLAGGTLDTVLLEQGVIAESTMLEVLGRVSGLNAVNLNDFEPNREVAPLIPRQISERLGVVPLSLDDTTLHVAATYPVALKELDEVGVLLGKIVLPWVAIGVRVHDWMRTIYGRPLIAREAVLLAMLDPNRIVPPPTPMPMLEVAPAAGPLEEDTLEASLTRDMVERLAESVAQEPIPLSSPKVPIDVPNPRMREGLRETLTGLVPPIPVATRRPAATTDEIPIVQPVRIDPPSATMPVPLATYPAPAELPRTPAPATVNALPPQERRATPVASMPATAQIGRERYIGPLPNDVVEAPKKIPTIPAFPGTPVPVPIAPSAPIPAATVEAPKKVPTIPAFPGTPVPTVTASRLAMPAPNPARDEIPSWTLDEARQTLHAAREDREAIKDVTLRYARRAFDFVAAFAVIRGTAVGWDALSEGGVDVAAFTQVSLPLDSPSVFRTVALTRGSYVGPVPQDALTREFLARFGRNPRTVVLVPVEVKARLVALIYADSSSKPVSQRRLSDFLLFAQSLPGAFADLIVSRKQKLRAERDLNVPDFEPPTPHPVAVSLGWSPSAKTSLQGLGRAAGLSAFTATDASRPPADFSPLLRRLTGPDATQRARAMTELSHFPEASARHLIALFPGPTAWSRLPVQELPDADELGPISGALARLGRPAAQCLAPLLDANDPDLRYYALLAAGNLPYPELVAGLLRGLFDLEPDISSAARAACTAFRRVQRFENSMKGLRQELAALDPMRRSLAARALGALHDRDAVDGLIGLTGSDDALCAQAAAEALHQITRATLGTNPRAWTGWWAENRGRRRSQWLVTALRSSDLDVRLVAFEELSTALHDTLGYVPELSAAEREPAIMRWEEATLKDARLRKVD